MRSVETSCFNPELLLCVSLPSTDVLLVNCQGECGIDALIELLENNIVDLCVVGICV